MAQCLCVEQADKTPCGKLFEKPELYILFASSQIGLIQYDQLYSSSVRNLMRQKTMTCYQRVAM